MTHTFISLFYVPLWSLLRIGVVVFLNPICHFVIFMVILCFFVVIRFLYVIVLSL